MNNLDEIRNRIMESGIGSYDNVVKERRGQKVRRYDVFTGNTLVDTHLTMAQARRYRKEYPDLRIIEYTQPIEKQTFGKETEKIPGKQNFATPEMTKRREEARKRRKSVKRPKAIETTFGYIVDSTPGRNRNSLLHKEYIDLIKKDGFIVKYLGRTIFIGLENEIVEFFKEKGWIFPMDKCEITWNGKKVNNE